jgi:hypothetical protein
MFFAYMLQFLDKTALGYTAIFGIQKDLVGDHFPNRELLSFNNVLMTTGSYRGSILLGIKCLLFRLSGSQLSGIDIACQITSWNIPGSLIVSLL